jgi:hypothetical protein
MAKGDISQRIVVTISVPRRKQSQWPASRIEEKADEVIKKIYPKAKRIHRRMRRVKGEWAVEVVLNLRLGDLVALPKTVNEIIEKQPKAKAHLLKRLMYELSCLHKGVIKLWDGQVTCVPGGIIPLPQTRPEALAIFLATSSLKEWREILANEVLLYLERAHRADHVQAASDAREWCQKQPLHNPEQWCDKYHQPIPDWLIDAPLKVKRQGQDSYEEQQDQFWKDLMRFLAVELAVETIQAERESGAKRDHEVKRDRYWRAKKLLAGTWANTPEDTEKESTESTKGIVKSYKRFKDHRDSYYFSPATLMQCLKTRAPILHEILS